MAMPLFEAIRDGLVDPSASERFWVEAGSMSSGGSGNQLELPRGANRFFGFTFTDYNEADVTPIGQVNLSSGSRFWADRPLRWHGDNAMERLNLPTLTQGGFAYRDTAVMFRRTAGGYALEVAAWESDEADGWRQASESAGTLFPLGSRTSRVCGLL